MADNFPEDVEDIECPPEVHAGEPTSAKPSAVPAKRKMPVGRRITKENAKQYQLSAAQAKMRRKKVRAELLARLTTDFNLAEEMKKALLNHDEQYLKMCETALKIIGLHYDQSDEGRAQRLDVKSEMSVKKAAAIKVVFTEAKQPLEEVKPES